MMKSPLDLADMYEKYLPDPGLYVVSRLTSRVSYSWNRKTALKSVPVILSTLQEGYLDCKKSRTAPFPQIFRL